MLLGKFCIDFGFLQMDATKHCAKPFRDVSL